ncbi:MAG: hypothetical protein AB9866_29650 [Syntrophobacteraceae bacterium]
MAEYGSFLRDRENLDRQISEAKVPGARKALELRKQSEGAEYMAITSDRIANQSEIIVGHRNTEEALEQRERAAGFRKEAQELRAQFRGLHAERGTDKAEQAEPQKIAEPQPQQKEAEVKRDSESPVMVEERMPGQPRGKPQKLNDFVNTIPLPAKPEQRAFTATTQFYGSVLQRGQRHLAVSRTKNLIYPEGDSTARVRSLPAPFS